MKNLFKLLLVPIVLIVCLIAFLTAVPKGSDTVKKQTEKGYTLNVSKIAVLNQASPAPVFELHLARQVNLNNFRPVSYIRPVNDKKPDNTYVQIWLHKQLNLKNTMRDC